MYEKHLGQAQMHFAIAARLATDFLYYGLRNSQTMTEFLYNFHLGTRYYDDASHYKEVISIDHFVSTTLGEGAHSDIVSMLDYNSA